MDVTFIDSDLAPVLSRFSRFNTIGFDLETTGLNPIDSRILLAQIAFPDHAYVIDVSRVNIAPIMPYFKSNKWEKIIQNAKFDTKFLLQYYQTKTNNVFDTKLAENVILGTESYYGTSLKSLALKYLGMTLDKDVRDSFINMHPIEAFSQDQIEYAAKDASILFAIKEAQQKKISEYNLDKVAKLEFELAPVVAQMELVGVPIDRKKWEKILAKTKQEHEKARLEMHVQLFDKGGLDEQMGMFERSGINLNSVKQIKQAFEKLGIDIEKTDERELSRVNHPAAKSMLEYRRLQKIISAYGEALLDKIHPFTGRIHADFNQYGTSTGRFSCKEPNLQQMPPDFRACVGLEDYKIVGADFANIELRILAEISGDDALMHAFLEGDDPHKSTAALMFGIPFDKVTKEERFIAKCVTGDTLIDTARGLIPIEKLSNFRETDSFTNDIDVLIYKENLKLTRAGSFYYGGSRECRKITLIGGRKIEGTPNHRVKVLSNGLSVWRRLDDLKVGDEILIIDRSFDNNLYQEVAFNFWNPQDFDHTGDRLPKVIIDEAWAEILGIIEGDGGRSGHSIDVIGHLQDMDFLENFRNLCARVGLNTTLKETRQDNYKVHIGSRRLIRFLERLGGLKTGYFPNSIINSPESVVCAYVRGLYDTDGWHSKDGVGFCSRFESLAREMQIVLSRLGIFSSLERTYNKTYDRYYWKVLISSSLDVKKYFDKIGFNAYRKSHNPKGALFNNKSSKPRRKNLVKIIESTFAKVYDLYVPDENAFIANGLVNHNTINFGISYGMGSYKLMDMLNKDKAPKDKLGIKKVDSMMKRYKDTYQRASRWLQDAGNLAYRQSFSQTMYGRRRWFDRPNTSDPAWEQQVASIKRQGANAIIQGCVGRDTLILTEDYGIMPIEQSLGYNGNIWDGQKYSKATISYSGHKPLFRINLGGRLSLDCSPNHLFKVITVGKRRDGVEHWKKASDLKLGDKIRLTEGVPDWHKLLFPDRYDSVPSLSRLNKSWNRKDVSLQDYQGSLFDLGCLLGRIASDGSNAGNTLSFFVADHENEIFDYLLEIAKSFGHVGVETLDRSATNRKPMKRAVISSVSLARQLHEIKNAIPKFIYTDSDLLRGYLRGFFDGDGGCNVVAGIHLTFGRDKERRAREIQKALAMLGIRAGLAINKYSYKLHIRKSDTDLFMKYIGFINKTKQRKAQSCKTKLPFSPFLYGRCLTVRAVQNTGVNVPMYDVINSESSMFMADGVVTHNSNADITKIGMLNLYEDLKNYNLNAEMILQVHDEIGVLAHKSNADVVKSIVVESMEKSAQELLKTVPVKVEAYSADYWSK